MKIDSKLIDFRAELRSLDEAGIITGIKRSAITKSIMHWQKIRNGFMRATSKRVSKAQVYTLIRAERAEKVRIALEQVEQQKVYLVNLGSQYAAFPSIEKLEEIKIQNKVLRSLKIIATNKERAYMNWLAKSDSDVVNKGSGTRVKIQVISNPNTGA